jgi:hypothetical protein
MWCGMALLCLGDMTRRLLQYDCSLTAVRLGRRRGLFVIDMSRCIYWLASSHFSMVFSGLQRLLSEVYNI